MEDLGVAFPTKEAQTMDKVFYEIDGSYYSYVSSDLISNGEPQDNWEVVLKKEEFTKPFDGILFDDEKILAQNPITYVVDINRELYPSVSFTLQD